MDRREFLITLATMTGIDVLSPLNVAVDQLFVSNTPTQTEIYYPYSAVKFGSDPVKISDTPIDGIDITTKESENKDGERSIQPVVESSPPVNMGKSMNEKHVMSIVIDSYLPWDECTIAILPRTVEGYQYEPQVVDTVSTDDVPCVKSLHTSELETRPNEPHTYIGVLVPSDIHQIQPNTSHYLGETTPMYYNGTHQVYAPYEDGLEFEQDVIGYDVIDYGGSYFVSTVVRPPQHTSSLPFTYTIGKSHFYVARQARRSIFGCWKESLDSPYTRYIANRISTFVDEQKENGTDEDKEWGLKQKYEIARMIVQSMKYELDDDGTQYMGYPRYPVETLVDTTVDCKDGTILLGGILQQEPFNCDTVMLIYDGHVNIGVKKEDVHGEIVDDPEEYVINGETYVVVETTSRRLTGNVNSDFDYVGAHDDSQLIDITPDGFIKATSDEEIFG